MDRQLREQIISGVARSLPEWASRNKANLTDRQMETLAHWVVNSFPWEVYRVACGVSKMDPPAACACPGTCMEWRRVPNA